MVTTVHEPPQIRQSNEGPRLGQGSGGGVRNLAPAGGFPRIRQEYAGPPASTGIWVVLASIGMTFAALTSAMVVRQGGARDWQHFYLPSILYLNTVVLLASSFTLEISRKRVAAAMRGDGDVALAARWLQATLGLGLLFVAGQYLAWLQLRAEGLYLATFPSSSFFYVFTAAHVLHLIGGLGGLVRVIRKLNHSTLRRSTFDATSRYWHFMDLLWVYLLLLLRFKL